MTNIWMLSKESMKGMDIVSVSSDVLYAFEQLTLEKRTMADDELDDAFQKGNELLSLLDNAVVGQTTRGKETDLFMIRVIESLEQSISLPPSMLLDRIEKAKKELEERKVSSETSNLFEKVSQAVMAMTSRSVEALSTSLR